MLKSKFLVACLSAELRVRGLREYIVPVIYSLGGNYQHDADVLFSEDYILERVSANLRVRRLRECIVPIIESFSLS